MDSSKRRIYDCTPLPNSVSRENDGTGNHDWREALKINESSQRARKETHAEDQQFLRSSCKQSGKIVELGDNMREGDATQTVEKKIAPQASSGQPIKDNLGSTDSKIESNDRLHSTKAKKSIEVTDNTGYCEQILENNRSGLVRSKPKLEQKV